MFDDGKKLTAEDIECYEDIFEGGNGMQKSVNNGVVTITCSGNLSKSQFRLRSPIYCHSYLSCWGERSREMIGRYYEVEFAQMPCAIATLSNAIIIGYAGVDYNMQASGHVGSKAYSIGTNAASEIMVEDKYIKVRPSDCLYKEGDIVGIGIHSRFDEIALKRYDRCFITRNGTLMGSVQLDNKFYVELLLPTVTIYHTGKVVAKANFSKPFHYNPEQLLGKNFNPLPEDRNDRGRYNGPLTPYEFHTGNMLGMPTPFGSSGDCSIQ